MKVSKGKHLDFFCLCCSTIFILLLHDAFRYNLMWEVDLEKLPIKELTTQDALLFVWVTNKQKLLRYVKETLFPLWSVQLLTQWYWLKVGLYEFSFSGNTECSFPLLSAIVMVLLGKIAILVVIALCERIVGL